MIGIYNTLGFFIIIILYTSIGLLAVFGSITITKKLFNPHTEQVFYAVFLILIACFYLAFILYFKIDTAWRIELIAASVFCLIGLIGTKIPSAIIFGYPLHGIWDLLHEFHLHSNLSIFEPGQITTIPLAYGFFCITYDVGIAIYFYIRRDEWQHQSKADNQN